MKHKILQLNITMQFDGVDNTIHPSLLWDDENIILIDCGYIGSIEILETQLCQYGLSLQQLTGLVLTHHDHDHMGSAAALKSKYPHIIIYSSPEEATYISAQEKPLRLHQAEEMQKILPPEQQAFGIAFCNMLRLVEPVQVDTILLPGEHLNWCGGCRIIATPGHTPGHISLLMEVDSIVITGDAFALEDNLPVIANPQFTLNITKAEESMKKLLSMKSSAYHCYHGGVYTP